MEFGRHLFLGREGDYGGAEGVSGEDFAVWRKVSTKDWKGVCKREEGGRTAKDNGDNE